MQTIDLTGATGFFDVLAETERSQAASMRLRPGQSTGGSGNVHPTAEQWLFVIEGQGAATVEGRDLQLAPGTLILIEPGESHEIRANGEDPLETLSVYAPPAY